MDITNLKGDRPQGLNIMANKFWTHWCPVDHVPLDVEFGFECNWCGELPLEAALEPQPALKIGVITLNVSAPEPGGSSMPRPL